MHANASAAATEDLPSLQLHAEIRDALIRALATRRPLLHHLNADTSWLLQIPRPANAVKHGSRIYYNVLIDPWFVGGQSDVASWFSQQWHATESAVKSVSEVEELARRVERLACGGGKQKQKLGKRRAGANATVKEEVEDEESMIDAVTISHEFTDHCHKDTLLEVHADVPVFATEQAARLITGWKHFRTVVTTPTFTDHTDWRDTSLPPLPSWLSIARLTASNDALYYHSALLIAFATHPFLSTPPSKKRSSLSINGDGAEDISVSGTAAAECILYTPHGIPHSALTPIATADPPLRTLAFLHGLHDVSISAAQQLNLGARNGLLAQRVLRAKYWVATHDEVKKGGGLVSWFLRRRAWTLEEALMEAKKEVRGEGEGRDGKRRKGGELEDVRFQTLGNGESRVLE